MADNINGIPFSSEDEGWDIPDLVKQIVFDRARTLIDFQQVVDFKKSDVYLVWFCYILGGWKALCSTNIPDGRYYEVTYNKDRGVAFVDTYRKTHNVVVEIRDHE